MFKIVLGYMTRCKVLPCNADKRGSTSTYFFDRNYQNELLWF